jgi:hypothetical protein
VAARGGAVVKQLLSSLGGIGRVQEQGKAPAAQTGSAVDTQNGLDPLSQQDSLFRVAGHGAKLETAGGAAAVIAEQPGNRSGTAELQASRGDPAAAAGYEEVVEGPKTIAGDFEAQPWRLNSPWRDLGGCREKMLNFGNLFVEVGGLALGARPDDLDVTDRGAA